MILGGEAHLGTAGRLAVSNVKGEILVSNTLKHYFIIHFVDEETGAPGHLFGVTARTGTSPI